MASCDASAKLISELEATQQQRAAVRASVAGAAAILSALGGRPVDLQRAPSECERAVKPVPGFQETQSLSFMVH
jgi:hypothetical protein